jgi:hypothetical protein
VAELSATRELSNTGFGEITDDVLGPVIESSRTNAREIPNGNLWPHVLAGGTRNTATSQDAEDGERGRLARRPLRHSALRRAPL